MCVLLVRNVIWRRLFPAGQYASGSSCFPCPQGRYQSTAYPHALTSCNTCDKCVACGINNCRTAGATTCSCTADTCSSWPAGTYSDGANCGQCQAGMYSSSPSSSSCTQCSAASSTSRGTYSSSSGSTQCTACSGNQLATSSGMSTCFTCPNGVDNNGGGSCAAGQYSPYRSSSGGFQCRYSLRIF